MGENTQPEATVRWRMLDFRSDEPDELGQLTMHLHVKNMEDNQTYLVSVTGLGTTPSKSFVLALNAAAQALMHLTTQAAETKPNEGTPNVH